MRIYSFLGLSTLIFCFSVSYGQINKAPTDYVDPLMGTSESRWMLNPGVTRPFGMVQLSPDNQGEWWKGGYEYNIASISGFSHIHSWTMAGLSVMPTTEMANPKVYPPDAPTTTGFSTGHRSRIDKKTEKASPGYYSVELMNYHTKVELTSTKRAGFFRITYPKTDRAYLIFNLLIPAEYKYQVDSAVITKVSDREIEGYSVQSGVKGHGAEFNDYTVYFVARLNKPFDEMTGWEGDKIKEGINKIKGKGDVGVYLSFKTKKEEEILLETGISLVSIDQARLNLNKELNPFNWDFDLVKEDAKKEWNNLLGKIEVSGGTERNKKKFYTNLYRSYVARTTWSDVNGEYMDPCENRKQLDDPESVMLGSDAFWNTFWNLNQLWTLVNPDIASKWVKSELQMYKDGGWLSRGPAGIEYSGIMVASHEIPLIVSAYQKGIRDYDVDLAWEAILHQQTEPGHPYDCGGRVGNDHLASYLKYGYVPVESGPVSNTLEYAYDDWTVSQMAKALGKEKEYRIFSKRAQNYRNVFDPETKFVRPKSKDGSWLKDFEPLSNNQVVYGQNPNYVEGNAWQYTFFVPQDIRGLIALIGRKEFNDRLNEGFEKSEKFNFNALGDFMEDYYINHGNQPNMQAAYLFNYSGMPWLTQKWVREIQNRYYGDDPYGAWPGDEDEGQMGAWFVMSAIGLFETDGGASVKPFYEIGSPLFESITIHLDTNYYSGKTFVIEAKNASDENCYIQSASLNGRELNQPWFYHDELVKGGKLELVMGAVPNKDWGSAEDNVPPSFEDH